VIAKAAVDYILHQSQSLRIEVTYLKSLFYSHPTTLITMVDLPKSEQLHEWLSEHAEDLVGAAFAILSIDGSTEVAVAGRPDIENAEEVTVSTSFMLGSTIKVLTAALVCRLVEKGELSFDDSIAKWLPETKAIFGQYASEATIRQLLSHSGGIVDYFEPVDGLTDLVTKLAKVELVGPPGKIISYSNAGYMILGALLEKVTGRSWDTLARSEVLDPLKLSHFYLGSTTGQNTVVPGNKSTIAEDHVRGSDGKFQKGMMMWPRFPGIFAAAGTTASASIEDGMLLFRELLWPGSPGVLGLQQATYLEMQKVQQQMPGPSVLCEGWGLGWSIIDSDRGIIGHMGGTSTFVLASMELGKAAIFLSNTANGARIGRALAFRAIGLADPLVPSLLPRSLAVSGSLADYEGRYASPVLSYDVSCSSEGPTKLLAISSLDAAKVITLEHISGSTYLGSFAGFPTEFTFLREDALEKLRVRYLHVGIWALVRVSED
jgi:CubicO group peptidase (beta-lactamase class C family)